ncbi:MAG: polyprenyl diphosphate synthase [Dehalococcoidia bacterium]
MVGQPATTAQLPLLQLRAIPEHVAIIMDGNGRWAQARSLDRSDGHRAGARAISPVIERLAAYHVRVITLFGFSTENWGRPRAEVEAILRLGGEFIDRHLDEFDRNGVQLRHLGDIDRLPRGLRARVRHAVERTRGHDGIVVNFAFNYGGRADIVRAVQTLIADGLPADAVTEEAITRRLATGDLPEPDLLIRTGGERRLSNFLVWQSAYSEYYFTETLWPAFCERDVDQALAEYSRPPRRFGRVTGDGDRRPAPAGGWDDEAPAAAATARDGDPVDGAPA